MPEYMAALTPCPTTSLTENGEPAVHRLGQVEVAAQGVAGEQPPLGAPALRRHRIARQQAVLEEPRLLQVVGERLRVALLGVALPLQAQAALDQRQQHPAVERLEEEVERPFLQRAEELLVGLGDRAGDQDHVGLRPAGADRLAERIAVAILQPHVDQGEVEFLPLEEPHGLGGAGHGGQLIGGREHALDRPPHAGIVVDHQDPVVPAHATASAGSRRPASSLPASRSSTSTRVPAPAALVIAIAAAVLPGERAADGEAEPDAAVLGGEEGLLDLVEQVGRDARAVVLDGETGLAAAHPAGSRGRPGCPFSPIASSALFTRLSTM